MTAFFLLQKKFFMIESKQKIKQRFFQHSKANSSLGQAMRQCGIENFTVEIIENCKTQEELNEREKFWIKVLNSKISFGYNRTDGGGGFQKYSQKILPKKTIFMKEKLGRVE